MVLVLRHAEIAFCLAMGTTRLESALTNYAIEPEPRGNQFFTGRHVDTRGPLQTEHLHDLSIELIETNEPFLIHRYSLIDWEVFEFFCGYRIILQIVTYWGKLGQILGK